MELNFTH